MSERLRESEDFRSPAETAQAVGLKKMRKLSKIPQKTDPKTLFLSIFLIEVPTLKRYKRVNLRHLGGQNEIQQNTGF